MRYTAIRHAFQDRADPSLDNVLGNLDNEKDRLLAEPLSPLSLQRETIERATAKLLFLSLQGH